MIFYLVTVTVVCHFEDQFVLHWVCSLLTILALLMISSRLIKNIIVTYFKCVLGLLVFHQPWRIYKSTNLIFLLIAIDWFGYFPFFVSTVEVLNRTRNLDPQKIRCDASEIRAFKMVCIS